MILISSNQLLADKIVRRNENFIIHTSTFLHKGKLIEGQVEFPCNRYGELQATIHNSQSCAFKMEGNLNEKMEVGRGTKPRFTASKYESFDLVEFNEQYDNAAAIASAEKTAAKKAARAKKAGTKKEAYEAIAEKPTEQPTVTAKPTATPKAKATPKANAKVEAPAETAEA